MYNGGYSMTNKKDLCKISEKIKSLKNRRKKNLSNVVQKDN